MVTKSRFEWNRLIFYGGKYIYRNDDPDAEYNRICSDHMDKTVTDFFTKMGAIFVSYLFAVIGPIQTYIMLGKKSTTTEARIPFCEPKSNAEFLGNFIFQGIIASHGLLMYIGLEVMFSIVENVVTIAPKLVENELSKVIRMIEDKSFPESELFWRMRRVVMPSQDTDE